MWCRNGARGVEEEAQQIRAELELAARARHAVRVVVVPCPMEGQCTSEMPFSFGARPWCDVPAAASEAQLAFA